MKIRRALERGHAEHGWLESYHTFSFADYIDRAHMGFRALRVINEDRVQAGQGFGRHPHRDMEIVSYVLEGALEHKDSMGNGSVIRPGDVQRMSAGTGVFHSEFNASKTELVHFLQIWIVPDREGHAPGYEQKAFSVDDRRGKLRLVASSDGRDGSVTIHQDARMLATLLARGESVTYDLAPKRGAWIHVARGSIEVDGTKLEAGDAAAIEDAKTITLAGALDDASEALVFDLA
jgi:hypothetical protein